MEKLLKDIADAIEAAAQSERIDAATLEGICTGAIPRMTEAARMYVTARQQGVPAEVILQQIEDRTQNASKYAFTEKIPEVRFTNKCALIALSLIAAHIKDMGKPGAPEGQGLTFEGLFQFSRDKDDILEAMSKPLPNGGKAVENGKWVYTGKAERALVFAIADAIKEQAGKTSLKKEADADTIAKAIADYFGLVLPPRAGRARYRNAQVNFGDAPQYTEFKDWFIGNLQ